MITTRNASAPIGLAAVVLLSLVPPAAQEAPTRSMRQLRVPPGFEVEQIAGPPLVDRPIVADFDEEGRLYVADSSGSNERVEKQLADRPHRIVRLEDANGDGRFDKSVVFADKMMLPEGTMWLDGSLYVAAPPSIWKLTDIDGDGVADRREEWFKGETLTGCANDLHGPYLGPDGWIYWTKGAFAQQTHARAGKPSLVTRAAHIFRRRPGDTALEVVMTGGMDNPVDVAFTPTGERILTATFLEHPQAGRRDALVHAIYGGVYGKPHAVLDGHTRTGDLMPVMCQLGPAVPAGLTRYASRVFGAEYRDSFFAAMFNLRKVTRHVLEPSGATFTTRDFDFLSSDDRDFHPTDVIEDADGSLIVVDTGPWYKLCCPTSQLAKPDVLGAVYRVRRKGATTPRDPRGRTIAWNAMQPSDLTRLLDDSRPAVVERALRRFSTIGEAAVPAIVPAQRSGSIDARRNAVWALARIDGQSARSGVRTALSDRDVSVRAAAVHAAGLWRDALALPSLVAILKSAPPALQRSAAEALGRIGDARAVPDMLALSASPADRVLEHSLTYALIEIGDARAIANAGLGTAAPRARRTAMIALDQIDGGQLTADTVLPLLDSSEAVLKDTAWWIAARHPEWGGALSGFFQRQLVTPTSSEADRADLQQKLAAFAGNAAIQQLLADAAANGSAAALRAMAAAASSAVPSSVRLKELPAAWRPAVARAMTSSDDEVVRLAVAVARVPAGKGGPGEIQPALARLARAPARAPALRLEALAVLSESAAIDPDLFDLLRTSLAPDRPAHERGAAAAAIEKAKLDADQLKALVPVLESATPLDLPRILRAFESSRDETLGLAMIAALERSPARAALRADMLRPHLANYPDPVKRAGERLIASVQQDSGKQAAYLESLLGAVGSGDAARGQTVFNSTKAACLSCHTIGYIGGRIGPDLTKIGQVRGDRDLLESIVFPSASFARGYETVVVHKRGGAIVGGVLRSDAPDEVIVSDVSGNETRIARGDVADMQPAAVSLMPPGFGDLLTRQEMADLLAFLRAAK